MSYLGTLNEALIKARAYNVAEVQRSLNAAWVQEKIPTLAKRLHISRELVRHHLLHDPLFAAQLAKDPLKQNITEKVAVDYLTDQLATKVHKLPASGRNALFVVNGLRVDSATKPTNTRMKSLDFWWTGTAASGAQVEAYAAQKYADDSGGSQDAQLSELERVLEQAQRNGDKTVLYLAIADGALPNKSAVKWGGATWYAYANAKFGSVNSAVACSSDEVADIWDTFLLNA